ncbi:hypothetical protein [Paraburkholderia sp. C35]|uniref:hypothetical protein n=1 Tax=Paraburkholderia sp. C35 TaxID=2126993 RepID=UPI0013A5BCC0|nr:hypothetical protein [Paraburkholderia sp. C35]
MSNYTPEQAHSVTSNFLGFISLLAYLVLEGKNRKIFDDALAAAEVCLKLPPSKSTCNELGHYLGIMEDCMHDAPLLYTKPEDQVLVVLDSFSIPGIALAVASGHWRPAGKTSVH